MTDDETKDGLAKALGSLGRGFDYDDPEAVRAENAERERFNRLGLGRISLVPEPPLRANSSDIGVQRQPVRRAGHRHCFHNAKEIGGTPSMSVCCGACQVIRLNMGTLEHEEKTHGFAWQPHHLEAVRAAIYEAKDAPEGKRACEWCGRPESEQPILGKRLELGDRSKVWRRR